MARRAATGPELTGAIYGRQSLTRDGSESLETQLEECRKAAKTFRVKVVAEILEPPSTSAYKKRGRARPRFPELLELVRTGAVGVIIIYKTDRLSRGGGPGWAPVWDAAEESPLDLDLDRFVLTPDGYKSEFELGIRATMDREESKKSSDRLTDMKERHAAEGRPSGGGRRPYGYADDRVTVVEAEAKVIRDLVARYLAGEGLRLLTRWLNEQNIPTVEGKGEWQVSTVTNLLKNPRIAGLRVHRGEVVGDAVWPAIIDRPTWERLRSKFEANARGPGQGPSKYLLQSIATCDLCGGKLTGAPVLGRARYRCQKAPGRVNCGGVTIACEPVDDLVTGMVLYRLDSPAVAGALAGRTSPADDDEDIHERILGYESRLEEASSMFAEGEIDRKELVAIRRQIGGQLDRLRARMAMNETRLTLTTLVEEGSDLASMWEGLDQGRRRQILRALIDEVRIKKATKRGSNKVDLNRVEVRWRA